MKHPSLNAAIDNDDLEAVKRFIAAGADVNEPDEQGLSPLGRAAAADAGNELIECLIAAGADAKHTLLEELKHLRSGRMVAALLKSDFDLHGSTVERDALWDASKLLNNEDVVSAVIQAVLEDWPDSDAADLSDDQYMPRDMLYAWPRVMALLVEHDFPGALDFAVRHGYFGFYYELGGCTLDELHELKEEYGDGNFLYRWGEAAVAASRNTNPGVFQDIYQECMGFEEPYEGYPDREDAQEVILGAARWLPGAVALWLEIYPDLVRDEAPGTGPTPLQWAAQYNPDEDTTKVLLEAGGNVESRDKEGLTPLLLAARSNHNPWVTLRLLCGGADPTVRDAAGATPLDHARLNPAMAGSRALQALEELSAMPDAAARLARAQEYVAAREASKEDLLTLTLAGDADLEKYREALIAGADVEAQGSTRTAPIVWAGQNCTNPEVIRFLVAAGANLAATDTNKLTALINAAGYNDNPEVVPALLEAGADPRAREGIFGATALMYACAFRTTGAVQVIRALLDAGAELETRNLDGRTALLFAAQHTDNPEVIRTLVAAGANVNARDNDKLNAIQIARQECLVENSALIRELEAAGVRAE